MNSLRSCRLAACGYVTNDPKIVPQVAVTFDYLNRLAFTATSGLRICDEGLQCEDLSRL
jgi:hypothetical protein